jgi:hypothetical protein
MPAGMPLDASRDIPANCSCLTTASAQTMRIIDALVVA